MSLGSLKQFAAEYDDRNIIRNTVTTSGLRPHASEPQKQQLNLKSQLLLAYCNNRSITKFIVSNERTNWDLGASVVAYWNILPKYMI
jgi:hypothetical protein